MDSEPFNTKGKDQECSHWYINMEVFVRGLKCENRNDLIICNKMLMIRSVQFWNYTSKT